MAVRRLFRGVLLITVAVALTPTAWAALPPRPEPGEGSNFYVQVGLETIDFDLDPRSMSAEEFLDTGLDVIDTDPQALVGVGWIFHSPLRLDLTAGGGKATLQDPGQTFSIGRATADLHVAVLESRSVVLEGTASLGFNGLVYHDLAEDESITGVAAGLGATLRVGAPGPFGIAATYSWRQVRYQRTNLDLLDGTVLPVHPTASFHSFRVLVVWDL